MTKEANNIIKTVFVIIQVVIFLYYSGWCIFDGGDYDKGQLLAWWFICLVAQCGSFPILGIWEDEL